MTKSSLSIWHLLTKRQIYGEDLTIFCGLLRKYELYKALDPENFISQTQSKLHYGLISTSQFVSNLVSNEFADLQMEIL